MASKAVKTSSRSRTASKPRSSTSRAAGEPLAKRSARAVVPSEVDEPSTHRSEGARLLASLRGSLQQIADAIGASRQAACAWRTGVRVPEEGWRLKLQKRYAIPIDAWDRPPHSASTTDIPAAVTWFPSTDAEPSALEDCTRLLALLRSQLNRGDLLGRERVQLGDAFARALTQKERLEKAREMLEARTIREHPEWQRLKKLIIDALIPKHRAAALDVGAALIQAGVEDPS